VSATATLVQSERAFQTAVVEYAKLCGWKAFHPFDSRRSEPGWPDLALVRHGMLLFAELKTERGRVSPVQRDWLEALEAVSAWTNAVEVRLWRPSDWPEIERVLR
jgi:hypothetical protein